MLQLGHPMVHLAHQAGSILPPAAMEEEVEATPLRNAQATPSNQPNKQDPVPWPKDQPRLAFEISSADGFSCKADSMEGENRYPF